MSLQVFGALTGLFVLVYDGQHALKYTLGRAKSVVGPGIHFKLPILQVFRVEETKHTTLDLEPQVIQLTDDLVYEVDCKVMYQIVNLRKALIEIDDLVTGLQNRVVIAVQKIVSQQDRETVRDVDAMCEAVRDELRPVEDQWGVRILQFGFSNISPSPTTLEITQLDLLAREKLRLYGHLRDEGLTEEAAVALISGAVVSVTPADSVESSRVRASAGRLAVETFEDELARREEEREQRRRKNRPHEEQEGAEPEDPTDSEDDREV